MKQVKELNALLDVFRPKEKHQIAKVQVPTSVELGNFLCKLYVDYKYHNTN